jgi:S1-C subfamily serine protease
MSGDVPVRPEGSSPSPRRSAEPTRNRASISLWELALYVASGFLIGSLAVLAIYAGRPASQEYAAPLTAPQYPAAASSPARVYAEAAPGVVVVTADLAPERASAEEPGRDVATGTGFFINRSGELVTAHHVVDGSRQIVATTVDGTRYRAKLVDVDVARDVAILKIDIRADEVHVLELGSVRSLRVGTPVVAIGNPFGFTRSLTSGLVSGLGRAIRTPEGFALPNAIQTDTALNPGSSGGPLLTLDGRVVGIVSQIATSAQTQQSSGVGFAIPIDVIDAR